MVCTELNVVGLQASKVKVLVGRAIGMNNDDVGCMQVLFGPARLASLL